MPILSTRPSSTGKQRRRALLLFTLTLVHPILAAIQPPSPPENAFDASEATTLNHEQWPYSIEPEHHRLFALPGDPNQRIELLAGTNRVALWSWHGEWRYQGTLQNKRLLSAFDGSVALAAQALDNRATLSVGVLPRAALRITRAFDRIERGQTVAAPGYRPGQSLHLLLGASHLASGDPWPQATEGGTAILSFPEKQLRFEMPLSPVEWGGLGAGRRLVRLVIPKDAPTGSCHLRVELNGWKSPPFDFALARPEAIETRSQLAAIANQALQQAGYPDLALVGDYQPLPQGAIVCGAFDDQHSRRINDDKTWLFFAFEPAEGFAQDVSPWIMANEANGEVEIIEADTWPRVLIATDGDPQPDSGITCGGSALGPDFGYEETRLGQAFNAGQEDEGADANPDEGGDAANGDDPDLERVPLPGWYETLPTGTPPPERHGKGLTGLIEQPCPDGIRKIALLIQFDDNVAETREDGKQIPNFDDVMNHERHLVRALGFDGIATLAPDDFLSPEDYGVTGRPTNNLSPNRLLRRLKAKVAELVRGIEDPCCTELIIFFNSHQSGGDVKYRNREVPFMKDGQPQPPPPAEPKTKDLVKGSVGIARVAEAIAEGIREAAPDKRCPASQVIFHSCYSGRIAGPGLRNALTNGLSVVAASGSRQTTKGEREGDVTEYYFLEALRACLDRFPNQTLADEELWDCIVRETERRSGDTQTPERHDPVF